MSGSAEQGLAEEAALAAVHRERIGMDRYTLFAAIDRNPHTANLYTVGYIMAETAADAIAYFTDDDDLTDFLGVQESAGMGAPYQPVLPVWTVEDDSGVVGRVLGHA